MIRAGRAALIANEEVVNRTASSLQVEMDAVLSSRLTSLREEGQAIWSRFESDVSQLRFHPFVPSDYERVLRTLLTLRGPGLRFLEWGSATGVITIMADLLGFEAYGIEIDPELVDIARALAERSDSDARFAVGSFLPDGYEWMSETGDPRLGTIGRGPSGYPELGRSLKDFDLVFAFPWEGETPIMHDVMRRRGGSGARFLLYHAREGVQVYRRGKRSTAAEVWNIGN
jgi:SAM-dependent methyltransferase